MLYQTALSYPWQTVSALHSHTSLRHHLRSARFREKLALTTTTVKHPTRLRAKGYTSICGDADGVSVGTVSVTLATEAWGRKEEP